MKIPVDSIIVGERQRVNFNPESVNAIASSILEVGLINPITVKALGNKQWELVAGWHRLHATKQLGFKEIECNDIGVVTDVVHQKIELEEDLRRTDRSWQEKCLAVSKLFNIITLQKYEEGENWTCKQMAAFTGYQKTSIVYMLDVAASLKLVPRDEEIWTAENYTKAIDILRKRAEKNAQVEMEKRIAAQVASRPVVPANEYTYAITNEPTDVTFPKEPGQALTQSAAPITLGQRVFRFNQEYKHLWNQQLSVAFNPSDPSEQFVSGYWFTGGGNISDFYGAYQVEYLNRVYCLFNDIKGKDRVMHLFSGSIPPSPDYTVVGLPDANCKPEIECNAEQLSSFCPLRPDLIYADPPYSKEDSEHYAHCMVNRAKVIEECALILKPGGYIVWLDQALPVFSNKQLRMVGVLSYIRSTGNRFRCVVIFQKPL